MPAPAEKFAEIDTKLAEFTAGLAGSDKTLVHGTVALLSRRVREGDVCLPLAVHAGASVFQEGIAGKTTVFPERREWRRRLFNSGIAGRPGDRRPLIVDTADRLYFYRYWAYEDQLAAGIRKRLEAPPVAALDADRLKKSLTRYFPGGAGEAGQWQKIAVIAAVRHRFCVVSGGPGTGKTTVAARILASLQDQTPSRPLRMFLAAPTGKAAARLTEAIQQAKKQLNPDGVTRQSIPDEALTIHRLLKPFRHSPFFHYNAENRLPADVVLIDEASMVDLPLLAKLMTALPCRARLILMGDRHQLASVESGAVLADICDVGRRYSDAFVRLTAACVGNKAAALLPTGGEPPNKTADAVVRLEKSFRFAPDSAISLATHAINHGDGAAVLRVLQTARTEELFWQPVVDLQLLRSSILENYRGLFVRPDPREALDVLSRFRVLCALNSGPFGVRAINALAGSILHQAGFIKADREAGGIWYAGRPILITANDYDHGLYNGDVGITLYDPDKRDSGLFVFFDGPGGRIRRFVPYGLPAHETVYAMTVHKSQGSEFNRILVVLPPKDHPLLTRELLYTAMSRARQKISLFAGESVIKGAASRKVIRSSGLRDRLWPRNNDTGSGVACGPYHH